MNCSQFSEMLENYEVLTDMQKKLLDDHAAVCENCRNELEFFKSINETLHTLPKITAPESLLSDINNRIDSTETKKNERNKLLLHIKTYSYRYGAAAACIALLAVVGVRNSDLVNRMIYHDDGVISEVKVSEVPSLSTELPKGTLAPISTSTPTAKPKAASKVSSTQQPSMKSTISPTSKPSPSKATKSSATARPKSNTSATNSINHTTPVAVTQKPYVTVAPEVKTTLTPQATAVPTKKPEIQTTSPEAYTPVQSEENDTSYVFEQTYRLPKDEQNTNENISSNGYENNNAASPEDWAVVTATLTVSSEDEERVRELIDIYTSDQIGDQYKIDADRMQYMLDVFTQEGIEFNQSARQSAKSTDGDLMLTLVIS